VKARIVGAGLVACTALLGLSGAPARGGDAPAGCSGTGAPSDEGAQVIWPEDLDPPSSVEYLLYGDPDESDDRIDVVIVPDGYRVSQKSLMEQHAQELVDHLRDTTPFKEHDRFFNYILVYAYSVESGTDVCSLGIRVNTAMGTGVHGRFLNLSSCGTSGLQNLLEAESRAPDHDDTVVMVNTPIYGGIGGSRAFYSAGHGQAVAIAAHEMSHGLPDLQDEYIGDGCLEEGANEINTSHDCVEGAWPEWIPIVGPPKPGALEHGTCIYRPELDCALRHNTAPFCRVCSQQWALTIFGHEDVTDSAPIESVSPGTCLRVDPGATQIFTVHTRLGNDPSLTNEIQWKVDDVLIATGTESFQHKFKKNGVHRVTVEVVAHTNLIQKRGGPNEETVSWDVEVAPSLAVNCNASQGNLQPDWCEEPDCNDNNVPDWCDIQAGVGDCDGDGIPDLPDCETDCDGENFIDECDIALGFSTDCDGDGEPDDCEPAPCSDGLACNGLETCGPEGGCVDGVDPSCGPDASCTEVAVDDSWECIPHCPEILCCDATCEGACAPSSPPQCTSQDTGHVLCIQSDGELMRCPGGTVVVESCSCDALEPDADCPGQNQVLRCSYEAVSDCDEDGLADSCERDCNGDSVPDDCTPFGLDDCDHDGLPDFCETDCNGNFVPDDCEGLSDCNGDGLPDVCAGSGHSDCDEDEVPDYCETDCNGNLVPDDCEDLLDCNGNGVPDVCEPLEPCTLPNGGDPRGGGITAPTIP
jgi:hypothetical protein